VKKWIIFVLAFTSFLSYAASCPDPRLRDSLIGGDSIVAWVELKHKPLKCTQVALYFAGKPIWRGKTDEKGRFEIDKLASGKYWLTVSRWGGANVELRETLGNLGNGQRMNYSLLLFDGGCVATNQGTN
jgi:hypothetical protein